MVKKSWAEKIGHGKYRVFINNVHEGDMSYLQLKKLTIKKFPQTNLYHLVCFGFPVPLLNHYKEHC